MSALLNKEIDSFNRKILERGGWHYLTRPITEPDAYGLGFVEIDTRGREYVRHLFAIVIRNFDGSWDFGIPGSFNGKEPCRNEAMKKAVALLLKQARMGILPRRFPFTMLLTEKKETR